MTNTNAPQLPELARYLFRPAITEARLMTGNHSRDPVYVATLAEELRTIDAKITAIEEALGLVTIEDRDAGFPERPCRIPVGDDAGWIRKKSRELDVRLRRIEENTSAGIALPRSRRV